MAHNVRDDDQLAASDSEDDDYIPDSLEETPKRRAAARGSKKRVGGLVLEEVPDDDAEDRDETNHVGVAVQEAEVDRNNCDEGENYEAADEGEGIVDGEEGENINESVKVTRAAKRARADDGSCAHQLINIDGQGEILEQGKNDTIAQSATADVQKKFGERETIVEKEGKFVKGGPADNSVKAVCVATAKRKRTEISTSKSNIDDIWASLNKPIARSKSHPRTSVASGKADADFAGWLGTAGPSSISRRPDGAHHSQSSRPAPVDKALSSWLASGIESTVHAKEHSNGNVTAGDSAPVSLHIKAVPVEDVISRPSGGIDSGGADGNKSKRTMTGLEKVLSSIKDDKAPSVLDRTRNAWSTFKKTDVEIAEELEMYKKDKNRYTDKVAFLERADVRAWQADMERKKKR